MAQDSQYWTQQYGPRASLLSGAVIGSVGDISGTFYNPGALGLADELAFAISADVYEYESITIEDGAGRGVDLGTTKSGVRPSLLAGTINAVAVRPGRTRLLGAHPGAFIVRYQYRDRPVGV